MCAFIRFQSSPHRSPRILCCRRRGQNKHLFRELPRPWIPHDAQRFTVIRPAPVTCAPWEKLLSPPFLSDAACVTAFLTWISAPSQVRPSPFRDRAQALPEEHWLHTEKSSGAPAAPGVCPRPQTPPVSGTGPEDLGARAAPHPFSSSGGQRALGAGLGPAPMTGPASSWAQAWPHGSRAPTRHSGWQP